MRDKSTLEMLFLRLVVCPAILLGCPVAWTVLPKRTRTGNAGNRLDRLFNDVWAGEKNEIK